jgi:protein-S-isoprenylcysteine O-methyltransferase Ste14
MDKFAGGNSKRALGGLTFLIVLLWVILFLTAGSLDYWQAWVYWVVFSASISAIAVYFLKKDPKLIENRLKAGPAAEKENGQNLIQALLGILFLLLFVISALDHRFGWSAIPPYLVIAGDVFVLLGLSTIFQVFRENTYASGIIEVGEGQKVVTTGPYSIIRHPMYAGALLMLLSTPLALGSWWGLFAVLLMFPIIAVRLLEEEKFLAMNLAGYGRYIQKTRYRLIPFVW